MHKHSPTDTINYLRGNNWSYEVPIVICPNYTYYQFGEKNSLFEDKGPIEAKEKLINEIWLRDEENYIHKIFYRSSEDSGRNDTIFSSMRGELTPERFCRYGFDQIKFKLKTGKTVQEHEIVNLNIEGDLINLHGSYLNQNCRTQIVSYEDILTDKYSDKSKVYQTLTTFTTSGYHSPVSFQPTNLNDELRLFFRACETIEFKWKGRTTLFLENISNEAYEDCYESKSNDFWDNVVDLEYFNDHYKEENIWNLNKKIDDELYRR
jgi:hypothetical protein